MDRSYQSKNLIETYRASDARTGDTYVKDVNSRCDGWTGYMSRIYGGVMTRPRVVPICWGDEYVDELVSKLDLGIDAIVSDQYLAGLVQYGVLGAQKLKTVRIGGSLTGKDTNLTRDKVVSSLSDWIYTSRKIRTQPTEHPYNVLYLIFAPKGCTIEFQGLKSPGNLVAYHHWDYEVARNKGNPQEPNLYFAVIAWPTEGTGGKPLDFDRDGDRLVRILIQTASNEAVEAFTDRNGLGFKNEYGCEVCDVCETSSVASQRHGLINNVQLQAYWSNSLQGHALGDTLATDGQPIELIGYVGTSGKAKTSRLYLDLAFMDYIEIADDDVLSSTPLPATDVWPLERRLIKFGRDKVITNMITGVVDPTRVSTRYLEGPIHQKYQDLAQRNRHIDLEYVLPVGTTPSCCASAGGHCPSQAQCP